MFNKFDTIILDLLSESNTNTQHQQSVRDESPKSSNRQKVSDYIWNLSSMTPNDIKGYSKNDNSVQSFEKTSHDGILLNDKNINLNKLD